MTVVVSGGGIVQLVQLDRIYRWSCDLTGQSKINNLDVILLELLSMRRSAGSQYG